METPFVSCKITKYCVVLWRLSVFCRWMKFCWFFFWFDILILLTVCIFHTGWCGPDPVTVYSLVNNFYWTASAPCENWGRVSWPSGEYYNGELQDWPIGYELFWLFLVLTVSVSPLLLVFSLIPQIHKLREGKGGGETDRETGRERGAGRNRGWGSLGSKSTAATTHHRNKTELSGATTLTGLKRLLSTAAGKTNIKPFKDHQGFFSTQQDCRKLWLKP